jgi:hypothetical protein
MGVQMTRRTGPLPPSGCADRDRSSPSSLQEGPIFWKKISTKVGAVAVLRSAGVKMLVLFV